MVQLTGKEGTRAREIDEPFFLPDLPLLPSFFRGARSGRGTPPTRAIWNSLFGTRKENTSAEKVFFSGRVEPIDFDRRLAAIFIEHRVRFRGCRRPGAPSAEIVPGLRSTRFSESATNRFESEPPETSGAVLLGPADLFFYIRSTPLELRHSERWDWAFQTWERDANRGIWLCVVCVMADSEDNDV